MHRFFFSSRPAWIVFFKQTGVLGENHPHLKDFKEHQEIGLSFCGPSSCKDDSAEQESMRLGGYNWPTRLHLRSR